MASDISDYGLIGDGETCALVSRSGSVDFLCWPRFDSDACMAALLGDDSHGHWQIAPDGYQRAVSRRYRGDTLVLETTFTSEDGSFRLIDFMRRHDGTSMLVRIVEGINGTPAVRLRLRLRFNYGEMAPWSQKIDDGMSFEVGPDQIVLHSPVAIEPGDAEGHALFHVREGERIPFVLAYRDSSDPAGDAVDAEVLLGETEREWHEWIGRFDKPCNWPDAVKRSLITLKALIHRRTGGLLAAATLGLPEQANGAMNWDYRYCWLRDATFTLTALLNAGYQDEASRWRDWMLRAVAGRPDKMQIMYRLDGSRRLPEFKADWLPGYQGARPVLVGNAASGQLQLDVFGELLNGLHVAALGGIDRSDRGLEIEQALVLHLEQVWDKPGADIWETRGEGQRYTYSQAMAWVGIDRFLKGNETRKHADPDLLARLAGVRDLIHAEVCARGFDASRNRFVREFGGSALDASLLVLPLVGFLPADDPRMRATIAAIETEMMEGGLVRRMPAKHDGRDEGAFLACSCWLADCYKLQGRDREARAMLERVIGLSNDVGLLSEEFHVPTQKLVGNIPQALTHLGVVNTALFLSGPVLQRGA